MKKNETPQETAKKHAHQFWHPEQDRFDYDNAVQAFLAGFAAGQVSMREKAAEACLDTYPDDGNAPGDWPTPEMCVIAIRALPVAGEVFP